MPAALRCSHLRAVTLTGVAALALAAAAAPARAQITQEPTAPYPDPDKFARGLYSEAEVGTLIFLGDARGPLGPGAALGARFGCDFTSWVALQVHAFGSTHTTSFANLPQSGELLQIYQATAELKLTVRFGQLSLAAFGGAGYARLSTNLLGTAGLTGPDVRVSPVVLAGLGIDYHLLTRHFSFGASATFDKYQRLFTTGAVAGTGYIRYTF